MCWKHKIVLLTILEQNDFVMFCSLDRVMSILIRKDGVDSWKHFLSQGRAVFYIYNNKSLQ